MTMKLTGQSSSGQSPINNNEYAFDQTQKTLKVTKLIPRQDTIGLESQELSIKNLAKTKSQNSEGNMGSTNDSRKMGETS